MTDAPNAQTAAGEAGPGPVSFFTRLPGVFVCPFVGYGWAMIVMTMPGYLLAAAVLLVCFVLGAVAMVWVTEWVPLIGPLVAWAVCLYFVMVEMRILGLLYRTHARRLGWFEWDDDRAAPAEAAAEGEMESTA